MEIKQGRRERVESESRKWNFGEKKLNWKAKKSYWRSFTYDVQYLDEMGFWALKSQIKPNFLNENFVKSGNYVGLKILLFYSHHQ